MYKFITKEKKADGFTSFLGGLGQIRFQFSHTRFKEVDGDGGS